MSETKVERVGVREGYDLWSDTYEQTPNPVVRMDARHTLTLLAPRVVILLIGERPGLATVESLSAYLAYRPRRSDTDANRNLISNIHSRGVGMHDAARRIINLAARMMTQGTSGYQVREELPSPTNAEIVVPGPRLNDSTG